MTSEIQQSEGSQRMTLREASPMVTTENCARFAVDEVEQVTPSLGDYSVQSSTVEALVSPDESSVDETSHLTSRQTTSLSAETATLVVLTDAAESLTSSHDDSLLSSGIEMTSEILPNEEPESAVLIEASSIETTEIGTRFAVDEVEQVPSSLGSYTDLSSITISGLTFGQTLSTPTVEDQGRAITSRGAGSLLLNDAALTTEAQPRRSARLLRSSTRTRRSPERPSEPEAQNRRRERRKGVLWSADELTKLAELVERHRIASGRIMWADVVTAWESSRTSGDPERTEAALKAAYANLARRTERGTVRNAPPAENTLEEESQPATTETDLINQDSQQGGVEPVEHIEERSTSPNGDSETSQPDRTLGDKLRERFDAYYKAAKESHDRQPIRRPKGEIPEGMLQLANEILSEKLGHTNSTNKRTLTALNAAVYAIAKAITTILLDGEAEKAGKTHQKLREAKALRDTLVSVVSTLSHELRRRSGNAPGPPSEQYRVISRIQRVTTTVDIQRLRIRFKDQLKVVNSEIKTIEQALRRQRERQRGYPAVAREPREGEADVPVAEVREHWKSIIGESQPFHPSDDLQAWSRSVQRGENRAAVDLSEETWAKIFAKIKPWKATGPDGIQGFWWKKIPEARERLKSWCLDALHALRRKNVLHTLWVDMTKAFDSVSHGAIKWILARAGVASPTRRLLSVIMSKQSVRYCGRQNGKMVKSEPLGVRRGVMQGDTLSPLLFCMAIAPISAWLRNNVSPYRTSTGALTLPEGPLEINHLFYMDDLKVYSPRWDDIVKAQEGIQKVAGELGLRMNPSKCAVNSLNHPPPLVTTPGMDEIPVLGSSSLYKYLGAEQNALVSVDQLWSRTREKALAAARRIMLSDLAVRQKVNGYNQVVIPKLKYAISCVIYGTGKFCTMRKQARAFDESVRKLLAESHLRFGHSCVPRLYVNKEEGGLGLKSAEEEMEHTIVYTWCYLASRPEFHIPYHLCESYSISPIIFSSLEKEFVAYIKNMLSKLLKVLGTKLFGYTSATFVIRNI
ncbi:hypothetical protein COOONC_00504 [Cooperia oncophora]